MADAKPADDDPDYAEDVRGEAELNDELPEPHSGPVPPDEGDPGVSKVDGQ